MKDGGYLIVEVPNVRYFYWLLYRFVDLELLKMHNLDIMSPKALSEPIKSTGKFDILFSNYYLTNFLFLDINNPAIAKYPLLQRMIVAAKNLMKIVKLDNIPNRFFHPI